MAEFASKGLAGTALGFGIAGTALGLGFLNGNNGDGIFGLGGNKGCGNAHVTEKEMNYIQQLNAERAKLAEVTAERYADGIGIATYKEAVAMSNAQDAKFGALLKDVTSEVIRQGQEVAVLKADIRCLNSKVDYENAALNTKINTTAESLSKDIVFTNKSLTDAIALESERRACGDEKVVAWVQSQDYIKGVIKIDGSQICCGNCSPCNKS
ncbi:hypothetical protein [Cetobacterium sp.]|uniref:hypothetical protein n=1 Tax=Cetobacterium sp. TaxID=2071632 RepID=UPI003F3154EC